MALPQWFFAALRAALIFAFVLALSSLARADEPALE